MANNGNLKAAGHQTVRGAADGEVKKIEDAHGQIKDSVNRLATGAGSQQDQQDPAQPAANQNENAGDVVSSAARKLTVREVMTGHVGAVGDLHDEGIQKIRLTVQASAELQNAWTALIEAGEAYLEHSEKVGQAAKDLAEATEQLENSVTGNVATDLDNQGNIDNINRIQKDLNDKTHAHNQYWETYKTSVDNFIEKFEVLQGHANSLPQKHAEVHQKQEQAIRGLIGGGPARPKQEAVPKEAMQLAA